MGKIRIILSTLLIAATMLPVMAATPTNNKNNKKNGKKPSSQKGLTKQEIDRINRRRFDIHNIYVWGGAGYSGLVHPNTTITNGQLYEGDFTNQFVGSGGGLLGFGYEYNYKKFLLSVGPEFRLLSSMDKLAFSNPYRVTGLEYNQTKYYYLRDMKETQVVGQVMLPILLGAQFDQWYFKAGAKVGYSVLGNYTQKGQATGVISDPMAYEDWSTAIGHFNTGAYDYVQKGKNPFGLDLTVSAEVGLCLDKMLSAEWQEQNEDRDRPMRMRIALFADYGVTNMGVSTQDALASTLTADELATRSWMASEWGANKLNSLLVGVKFTWMLQMNKVKDELKQNGYLCVRALDAKTNKILPGTAMEVKNLATGKVNKKNTNSKGLIARREPQGDYEISAQRSGYISVVAQPYQHGASNDTARVLMRPIPIYTCYVRDAKSGAPMAAKVQFIDRATDAVVAERQLNANGQCRIELPINGTYRLHLDAEDHFDLSHDIAALDAVDTLSMEPIIRKRVIILKNLFFATNQTTILPESETGLQDLYNLLSENEKIRIRITGHTDNVGSDEANQILSEGRANSVRQNMIDRGIDPSRIEAEGKGESMPIAPNDTEEGRAQNRRVEFVIL